LCGRRPSQATRGASSVPAPQARQAATSYPSISTYRHLYVLNAKSPRPHARRVRPISTLRKASKYAACGRVDHDAHCARRDFVHYAHRLGKKIERAGDAYATRACAEGKIAPDVPNRGRIFFFRGPGIQALERINCAKLRNFCGCANAARASTVDARDGNFSGIFQANAR
jgi:hypothetical protein